jgi:hypothetical protein
MHSLDEKVKEKLRQIEEIDQERLRLLIRRRQVQREIWSIENADSMQSACGSHADSNADFMQTQCGHE